MKRRRKTNRQAQPTTDNRKETRKPDLPKGLCQRGKGYRFKRMVKRSLIREDWGQISEADAIHRAERYNWEIADGKNPVQEAKQKSTTFSEFAYGVWLPKKKATVKESSYKKYRSQVDTFAYFLERVRGLKDCPLGDIDYAIADDFITHRRTAPIVPNGTRKYTRAQNSGASKKTIHSEKEALKALFKEALVRKLIPENPFEEVVAKNPSREEIAERHNPLSISQQKHLLRAAGEVDDTRTDKENARFRDIVFLMLHTGLRRNEVTVLEWTDLDWQKRLIHVRKKTFTETRTIPIPLSAVSALKRLTRNKANDEPLFPNEKAAARLGSTLDIRTVDDLLKIKAGGVDLVNNTITLTQEVEWDPKGSVGSVPMCQRVYDLLEELKSRSTSHFVFPHRDGGRCRLKLLGFLHRARDRANEGIDKHNANIEAMKLPEGEKQKKKVDRIPEGLRIHDLRHTCGTTLRELGVPLETISGILRHASLEQTLVYAKYGTEKEGAEAIKKLDGV